MEPKPEAPPIPRWSPPSDGHSVPAVPAVPAPPSDPTARRIGNAERDETERHLRWALAEDILSIGEFDDRLGQLIRAKTQQDLAAIVADLPEAQPPAPSRTPLRPCSRIVAVMGSEDKRGRWRPGRPLRLLAIMGGVKIDLRDAESDDGVYDIDALAVMGGVDIVVPDDAEVDLDGFAVMGGRENKVRAPETAGGPLIRVNGYAVMGGVVVRPASKRERKKYPADSDGPGQRSRPIPPRHTDPPPRRKSWMGRIIGWTLLAALALGPGQAVVTADSRAIFGGDTYRPNDAELSGDDEVKVFALFGGVDVVIPEGHSARRDGGLSLFGGVDCERVCDRPGDEVQVDATAIFGGVTISDGLNLEEAD